MPAVHAALRQALGLLGRMGVQGQIIGQSELALHSTLFVAQDRGGLQAFSAGPLGIHVTTVRQRQATIDALVGQRGQATRTLERDVALRPSALSRPVA